MAVVLGPAFSRLPVPVGNPLVNTILEALKMTQGALVVFPALILGPRLSFQPASGFWPRSKDRDPAFLHSHSRQPCVGAGHFCASYLAAPGLRPELNALSSGNPWPVMPCRGRCEGRSSSHGGGAAIRERILRRVLGGTSDANIRFDDLCHLPSNLGFEMRVRWSHHIFRRAGVEEKVNLQREGDKAKPYQVRQVRAVILRYRLGSDAP